jgi:hypothetical protein
MAKTKKTTTTTADQNGNGKARKECPVSRAQFVKDAKPLVVTIDGINMLAEIKEFSTGSIGWFLNGKMPVKVGDQPVNVQIGLNMTIVGSKELPQ